MCVHAGIYKRNMKVQLPSRFYFKLCKSVSASVLCYSSLYVSGVDCI